MSGNDQVPLTQEGLNELKKEHQELINDKRPEVVVRMTDSRSIGDMTEDGEYAQAKQELAFIDGRISELGEVIKRAVVVDQKQGKCEEVALGCQVTVKVSKKDTHVFHLVGEWEADPLEKKISHQSPLGKALLGKKIGEKAEVDAPAGKIVYKVVGID